MTTALDLITGSEREQTRARYPEEEGFVERGGVGLFYEVYGTGEPTVLLLPTWSIIHSRHWKMQIPYLARHCRVLTFDGRGSGRSGRPAGPAAYAETEYADDALAVLDATSTERALLVSLSRGAQRAILLAALHPERVAGSIFIAPSVPLGKPLAERAVCSDSFDDELAASEGWAKYNRRYWLRDYRGFLEFFFSKMFNEPHSTKQIEDCVGWGLETTPETLLDTHDAAGLDEQRGARAVRTASLPGPRDPGRGRRHHRAVSRDQPRGGDRRPARTTRGLRPRPACA